MDLTCVVCNGPVDYDVDLNWHGTAVASATGTSKKCDSCGEIFCATCVSNDPELCKACAACDCCGRDAMPDYVDVVRGTAQPFEVNPFNALERLCSACYRVRSTIPA